MPVAGLGSAFRFTRQGVIVAGVTMAIDEKEWSADTKALAACLEALLQLVRGEVGPAAPAANDQRAHRESRTRDPAPRDIAEG